MAERKQKVGFIGAGNLAWNLAYNLEKGPYEIFQVVSSSQISAYEFSKQFNVPVFGNEIHQLNPDVEIAFLTTPDKEIQKVAELLKASARIKTLFVLSSGSVPLDKINSLGNNIGVIYPLQTFKKDNLTSLKDIPVFIEYTNQSADLIRKTAEFLSTNVKAMNSDGRLKLHLAAVFACNFPNLLWILTEELIKQNRGLSFSDFELLVKQNVNNVFQLGPKNALTGPAKRGDEETMQKHLELLSGDADLQEVYKLLSELIGKKK